MNQLFNTVNYSRFQRCWQIAQHPAPARLVSGTFELSSEVGHRTSDFGDRTSNIRPIQAFSESPPSSLKQMPLHGIDRATTIRAIAHRQRKDAWPPLGANLRLSSFLSAFARFDSGELHDPGRRLSGSSSIPDEGRFERQFSISDLG